MGDCRIIFHIDKQCLYNKNNQSPSETRETIITQVFSADTTIREIVDQTTVQIDEATHNDSSNDGNHNHQSERSVSITSLLSGNTSARLWDCTVHPPKDITEWPLHIFSQVQGSKSKTLYDAGWFPSGTLFVLPPDTRPIRSSTNVYDDIHYNIVAQTDQALSLQESSSSQPLASTLKPSEILQAAQTPQLTPQQIQEKDEAIRQAHQSTRVQRLEQLQKTEKRQRRVDERIQSLQEKQTTTTKNNNTHKTKVAAQVQRLLIKSQAMGRASLAPRDRIYFMCRIVTAAGVLPDPAEHTKHQYCFFSKQDTVGKVVDHLQQTLCYKKSQAELLIDLPEEAQDRRSSPEEESHHHAHGRLPTLWRLYECVAKGYLSDKEHNVVTVRVYDPTQEQPTAEVAGTVAADVERTDDDMNDVLPQEESLENTSRIESIAAAQSASTGTEASSVQESSGTSQEAVPLGLEEDSPATTSPTVVNPPLMKAIEEASSQSKKPTKAKKSNSAAAQKVRQMQIKSKALGDAKRVKLASRFYLEVCLVHTVASDGDIFTYQVESIRPYFLSITDSLNRLVRDYYYKHTADRWDYLAVPRERQQEVEENVLHRIVDPSQCLRVLEEQRLLQPFDKIVLMPLQNKN